MRKAPQPCLWGICLYTHHVHSACVTTSIEGPLSSSSRTIWSTFFNESWGHSPEKSNKLLQKKKQYPSKADVRLRHQSKLQSKLWNLQGTESEKHWSSLCNCLHLHVFCIAVVICLSCSGARVTAEMKLGHCSVACANRREVIDPHLYFLSIKGSSLQ